jgi:hypothetical protein
VLRAAFPIASHSESAPPRLCEPPWNAMFRPLPADVAQPVEQRFVTDAVMLNVEGFILRPKMSDQRGCETE